MYSNRGTSHVLRCSGSISEDLPLIGFDSTARKFCKFDEVYLCVGTYGTSSGASSITIAKTWGTVVVLGAANEDDWWRTLAFDTGARCTVWVHGAASPSKTLVLTAGAGALAWDAVIWGRAWVTLWCFFLSFLKPCIAVAILALIRAALAIRTACPSRFAVVFHQIL